MRERLWGDIHTVWYKFGIRANWYKVESISILEVYPDLGFRDGNDEIWDGMPFSFGHPLSRHFPGQSGVGRTTFFHGMYALHMGLQLSLYISYV